jgi:phage gp36-like protein
MSYCTTENITDRIGEPALIQLTDDAGAGEVDDDIVAAAIAASEATIDAYCQKRYTVPLSPIPAQIAGLCVDIAVYNLYSRSDLAMPEVRKDRYNAAIRFLEKAAEGKIELGASTPAQVNTDNTVHIDSATRKFTRCKMRDY